MPNQYDRCHHEHRRPHFNEHLGAVVHDEYVSSDYHYAKHAAAFLDNVRTEYHDDAPPGTVYLLDPAHIFHFPAESLDDLVAEATDLLDADDGITARFRAYGQLTWGRNPRARLHRLDD